MSEAPRPVETGLADMWFDSLPRQPGNLACHQRARDSVARGGLSKALLRHSVRGSASVCPDLCLRALGLIWAVRFGPNIAAIGDFPQSGHQIAGHQPNK